MIAFSSHRRGIAYVVTLWLTVVLTAVALAVGAGVRTGLLESRNAAYDLQVRCIEDGALRYAMQALTASEGKLSASTGMSACGIRLGQGAFWILGGDLDGDAAQEFTLVAEGGRLDLNTASIDMLLKLPGMTDEVAAGIIDWRDEDEDTTGSGAESDYYGRRSPSYQAHNAPFETVVELRMVIGVDNDILYGADANRDGMVSDNESRTSDIADFGTGLAGTTSAWLHWPDSDDSDDATDINSASRNDIIKALTEACGEARAEVLAEQIVRQRPFASIFHLYYGINLTKDEFSILENTLIFNITNSSGPQSGQAQTSTQSSEAVFLLDVNAAPQAVLATLPGLDESDAQLLVQAREDSSSSDGSLAWMLDAISKEKLLQATAAGVTNRSYQYGADILSLSGGGRTFRRARYVIDVSSGTPTVIYRQDLTHLGWPLEATILQQLRRGGDLDDVLSDARGAEDPS